MKTVTRHFPALISFLLLLLLLILVSHEAYAWDDDMCDRSRVAPNPKYGYKDGEPSHWNTLNPAYKLCSKGRQQSPINIRPLFNASAAVPARPIFKPYKSVLRFGIASHNYGFSCDDSFRPCGELTYPGSPTNNIYKLIQIHSHSPSEHRVNGVRYPLELHFVHQSASGQLAVFGTLFRFGRYNHELQHIIDAAQKRHYAVVDLAKLSGMTQADACMYQGSLTTPPCTEGVRWTVSLNVMQASLRQVGQYREQLGDSSNSRPAQNLFGRSVSCYVNKVQ